MFPFPLRILKAWGNFFWYLLWDSNGLHGGKSYKTVGTLLWMCFPGVFNTQTCIHWAPSCSPTTFQVFQFQHWFLWRFPFVSLCSGKWLFSVFTCQSPQSWGQWFALCPPLSVSFFSLLGLPKKICYIRVCSAFHLLKWSGDSKIDLRTTFSFELWPRLKTFQFTLHIVSGQKTTRNVLSNVAPQGKNLQWLPCPITVVSII